MTTLSTQCTWIVFVVGAIAGSAALSRAAVSRAADVNSAGNSAGQKGTKEKTAEMDEGDSDSEEGTIVNKSPKPARDANGGYRSLGLKSFEGIEEPTMKYVVADGKAEHDDFVNITDQGDGIVRMTLRYRGDWWDGDQATMRKDRQRAEVKGLGPHQKDGETFEYGTTFRTDPDFKGYGRFCHVFQLKAVNGDKGAPLVVLSLSGKNTAQVRYVSGHRGFTVAREFTFEPGQWETVKIRVKTTTGGDGELTASVNGDAFQGKTGLAMFRPQADEYRPKWGFYRGTVKGMQDDWVEHKDATARKTSG